MQERNDMHLRRNTFHARDLSGHSKRDFADSGRRFLKRRASHASRRVGKQLLLEELNPGPLTPYEIEEARREQTQQDLLDLYQYEPYYMSDEDDDLLYPHHSLDDDSEEYDPDDQGEYLDDEDYFFPPFIPSPTDIPN